MWKRIIIYVCVAVLLFGVWNHTQSFKLETVVEDVISSVVHIRHSNGWQGSGVIVSEDGIVLTARHVIGNIGGMYTITLDDGTEYKSITAVVSKTHDVGFIKIDTGEDLSFSHIENSDNLQLGQQIFMIGSPFGEIFFNSVTLGIVSGVREFNNAYYGQRTLIQTDAAGNPGNSGCPIFNMSGKIVGMVVGSPTRYYVGIVLCIESNTFKYMLDKVKFLFSMSDLEYVKSN